MLGRMGVVLLLLSGCQACPPCKYTVGDIVQLKSGRAAVISHVTCSCSVYQVKWLDDLGQPQWDSIPQALIKE